MTVPKFKLIGQWALLALFTSGCANELGPVSNDSANAKESGWVGADSFEVNAEVEGRVLVPDGEEWVSILDDYATQQRLIDLQVKFFKVAAENRGWRLNQLSEKIQIQSMVETDKGLEIQYTAVVDMLGRLNGNVPSLSRLRNAEFEALVPETPTDFDSVTMDACAQSDDGHSIKSYNFHYYFKPERSDCTLPLVRAKLRVTEVFDRPTTYPEYDQLMRQLPEGIGFRAALVPNLGDRDRMSRFDAHAEMLEEDLGLTGVESADGSYTRYLWKKGGVVMVIDLFDPTQAGWSRSGFEAIFRDTLKDYSFVHYNGHSSYGSKHLLDDPDAFSDDYQIIVMHSCQSFAYYSRQVFRAKATASDPQGFAMADVVATGKSSYPSGAPPTLNVILDSLMYSMEAIQNGTPEKAVDWITIAEGIKNSTWGDILYGVAGVRSNRWQP